MKGITNALTSLTRLSIPSELPVTDFKCGPKKAKNFTKVLVISYKFDNISII
jgi:hypothetical protein